MFTPREDKPMACKSMAILPLLFLAASPVMAQTAGPERFDGTWDVTLTCPQHTDGALGYTFQFPARIQGGALRGQNGIDGQPSWLLLQGPLQPDGTARLSVNGLTADPAYNIGRVAPLQRYAYSVQARFQGTSGTGTRLEGRACGLTFTKR